MYCNDLRKQNVIFFLSMEVKYTVAKTKERKEKRKRNNVEKHKEEK